MIALEALGRILQRNGVDADSSLTSVFAGRRTIEVVVSLRSCLGVCGFEASAFGEAEREGARWLPVSLHHAFRRLQATSRQ